VSNQRKLARLHPIASEETADLMATTGRLLTSINDCTRELTPADRNLTLKLIESLQHGLNAWKNFSVHVAHCAQCGEMSYVTCQEGNRLHDTAIKCTPLEDAQRSWSEPLPLRALRVLRKDGF
jgi:hypothetical protein